MGLSVLLANTRVEVRVLSKDEEGRSARTENVLVTYSRSTTVEPLVSA